eukprot:749557-Hanusia_phi.AAC.2
MESRGTRADELVVVVHAKVALVRTLQASSILRRQHQDPTLCCHGDGLPACPRYDRRDHRCSSLAHRPLQRQTDIGRDSVSHLSRAAVFGDSFSHLGDATFSISTS